MKTILCPVCGNPNTLIEISDGIYKCSTCGYTGYANGRGVIKK